MAGLTREEIVRNLSQRKIADTDFDRINEGYPVTKTCPTCDDQRTYKLNGEEFRCDCNFQRLLQKHYFRSNIGREYHDISAFDHFEGEDRDTVIPILERYIDQFPDNFHYGLGLTFSGPFGTGKTFSMATILKELIKHGWECYFITFEELITVWGSSWHDDASKKMLQDKLKRAEILGIDEVRVDKRNDTGFLAHGFDSVIRHRTSNLLPTLVTTNMQPGAERAAFSKVYSLLSARNERIEFKGHDRRNVEIRQTTYGLRNDGERRPIC